MSAPANPTAPVALTAEETTTIKLALLSAGEIVEYVNKTYPEDMDDADFEKAISILDVAAARAGERKATPDKCLIDRDVLLRIRKDISFLDSTFAPDDGPSMLAAIESALAAPAPAPGPTDATLLADALATLRRLRDEPDTGDFPATIVGEFFKRNPAAAPHPPITKQKAELR